MYFIYLFQLYLRILANLSKNQFYNLTDVYFHQSIVYENKTKIKYPLVSILNLGVEWKSENNIVKYFTTIGNTNKFLSIQIYILNFYRRQWKSQYWCKHFHVVFIERNLNFSSEKMINGLRYLMRVTSDGSYTVGVLKRIRIHSFKNKFIRIHNKCRIQY